ncbi:MAG: hypothetical protein WD648_11905 [Planctomycetaceae bacterium]
MNLPASAYWNQRDALASSRQRLMALHAAVGRPNDLHLSQFAHLFAVALEYRPDLILELGRHYGNSTCSFTEAANQLGADSCRVISLCRSPAWESQRPAAVAAVVPDDWFEPLTTYRCDILDFDYQRLLSGARRVMVFWDAHGYNVAECVLGGILPLLADRPHVVIMHDLSDARYCGSQNLQYGSHHLWRGGNGSGARLRIGHIDSAVEQAVAIIDFTTRNDLPLHSADESLHTELFADASKMAELEQMLGDEMIPRLAHWFWFSCNEGQKPLTFPVRRRRPGLVDRLRTMARVLVQGGSRL